MPKGVPTRSKLQYFPLAGFTEPLLPVDFVAQIWLKWVCLKRFLLVSVNFNGLGTCPWGVSVSELTGGGGGLKAGNLWEDHLVLESWKDHLEPWLHAFYFSSKQAHVHPPLGVILAILQLYAILSHRLDGNVSYPQLQSGGKSLLFLS